MKKAFFILLALSLFVNVFAQYDKHKLSLSYGPSFPVSDFGDKSITNAYSGSAKTGHNLNFYYCYNLTRNYSIGMKIFSNVNKYSSDAVIDKLIYSTGGNWTTTISKWSLRGALLGVAAHIPRSKKFVLDLRFFGGYFGLNSPGYTFTNNSISNTWYKVGGATSTALGYDIGTGFHYFYNSSWDILFNVDYIGANFIFNDIVTTNSSGIIDHNHNFRRTYDVINATIGVGYNFTNPFKKSKGPVNRKR